MNAFPVLGTCTAVGCIDPSFSAYSAIQGSGPICMRVYNGGGFTTNLYEYERGWGSHKGASVAGGFSD